MIDYVGVSEKAMNIIQGARCAIVITDNGMLVEGTIYNLVPAFVQAILRTSEMKKICNEANGVVMQMAKDFVEEKARAARAGEN